VLRPALTDELVELLEPLRQESERLANRTIELRYRSDAWPLGANELVNMLRFRQTAAGPKPFFDPVLLQAHVQAIATEVQQLDVGPRATDGSLRPVDVPATWRSILRAIASDLPAANLEFLDVYSPPLPGPKPGQSAPWIPAQ